MKQRKDALTEKGTKERNSSGDGYLECLEGVGVLLPHVVLEQVLQRPRDSVRSRVSAGSKPNPVAFPCPADVDPNPRTVAARQHVRLWTVSGQCGTFVLRLRISETLTQPSVLTSSASKSSLQLPTRTLRLKLGPPCRHHERFQRRMNS